jgi:hypothetical protein
MKTLLFVLIAFASLYSFAQQKPQIVNFFTDRKSVAEFAEGSSVFQNKEGKFGFIDVMGKEVIAAKFDDASSFSEGLAVVGLKKDGKLVYGYIDTKGSIAINPKYTKASPFKKGYALVENGSNFIIIDKSGKELLKGDESLKHFSNGVYPVIDATTKKNGFKNLKGKWVLKADKAPGFIQKISEDKAAFSLEVNGKQKFGVVDITGKTILPAEKYDIIDDYVNGFARVGIIKKERSIKVGGVPKIIKQYLYGYIDKNGKEVIAPLYQDGDNFSEGFVLVKDTMGHATHLDATGNRLYVEHYAWASSFNEGIASVKNDKGYYTYIDKTGKPLFPFGLVSGGKSVNGYIVSGLEGISLLDKNKRLVLATQFNEAMDAFDSVFWIKDDGAFFLMNQNANRIASFPGVSSFIDGFAAVRRKEHKGYSIIDVKGNVVLDKPTANVLFNLGSKTFCSIQDNDVNLINEKGELICKPPIQIKGMQSVSEDMIGIQNMNGWWGYMNTKGDLLMDCIFQKVGPFGNGKAVVIKDSIPYIIDKKGNVVISFKAAIDELKNISPNGTFVYKTPSDWILHTADNLEISLSSTATAFSTNEIDTSAFAGQTFLANVRDFRNGYAVTEKVNVKGPEGKEVETFWMGYIDEKGKTQFPFKLKQALSFSGMYFPVIFHEGAWAVIKNPVYKK